MQIDRKVVEQALEALEFMADEWGFTQKANRPERWKAISALQAALSQPEDKSQAAFEHWVETVEATQGCAISRNAVADAAPIIQPEIKVDNAEPEQEPELRELLISAAAIAVAAERNGAYQGASWVADAVLAQQGKGTSPQEQAEPDRVPVKRSGMQALSKALGHPTQISAKDGDTVDDALIELAVSRLEQEEQEYAGIPGTNVRVRIPTKYRDPSCVGAFNRAKPEHITDGSPCWCDPELNYVDPETGVKVWVHKEPQ